MKIVKAPAKVILFGEHSIVYPGHVAVLSTIGIYVTTKCERVKNESSVTLTFCLTGKKYKKTFDINKSIELYQKALNIREKFLIDGNIKELSELMHNDYGTYKVIIGRLSKDLNLKGLDLKLDIEIPVGAGLGSSAAISSTIIKSIYTESGNQISNDELFKISKEIEDFQHGRSSGVDPAVIINGRIINYLHNQDGTKKFKKIFLDNKLLNVFDSLNIINTGKSNESTGEMVSMLRTKYLENPRKFDLHFNRINEICNLFVKDHNLIHELINENGKILEELGVVSEIGKKLSLEIRKNKGSIKVAGGGGFKNNCGIMLVHHEDREYLKSISSKYGFELLTPKFCVDGIKLLN